MIDDDQINQALDRLARTADGELLYRFLQKTLMGTIAEHAPSEGTLRTEHGARRLAQNLMAKMAKGIDDSGGRTDLTGGKPSERTVVFRTREPSRASQHTSIRDAIRAGDPEYRSIVADLSGLKPGDD